MSDKPAPNISDAIENLRGVVAAQLLRPGQPGKPGLLSAEELRSQLEQAFKIMMLGRDADGGRAGVIIALIALSQLGQSHLPSADSSRLLSPVTYLIGALCALYDGEVSPVLAARQVNNRKPTRRDARIFKACCIVAAEILGDHGTIEGRRMSRDEADNLVRTRADSRAKQVGLTITNRSLETWRNALRKERRLAAQGRASRLANDVATLRQAFEYVEWNGKAAEIAVNALLAEGHLIRDQVAPYGFRIIPREQASTEQLAAIDQRLAAFEDTG